jgi:hypothetical protein
MENDDRCLHCFRNSRIVIGSVGRYRYCSHVKKVVLIFILVTYLPID